MDTRVRGPCRPRPGAAPGKLEPRHGRGTGMRGARGTPPRSAAAHRRREARPQLGPARPQPCRRRQAASPTSPFPGLGPAKAAAAARRGLGSTASLPRPPGAPVSSGRSHFGASADKERVTAVAPSRHRPRAPPAAPCRSSARSPGLPGRPHTLSLPARGCLLAHRTQSTRPRPGLCRSQPLAAPFKRAPRPMARRRAAGRGAPRPMVARRDRKSVV